MMLRAWFSIWLLAFAIPAFGQQDVDAEISTVQGQFESLLGRFYASQRRITSSVRTFEAQQDAEYQLGYVAGLLSSCSRELGVLTQAKMLAGLVTDKRKIPVASKIVELQRGHTVKHMNGAASHIDNTMHHSRDKETSSLLLEARDLLKTSSAFVAGARLGITPERK